MGYILHIETATDICSVALSKDGIILKSRISKETNIHSTLLTVLIQECLEESGIAKNELSAINISDGPGSYTSLRVGASVAKGICYALDIPLIATNTLSTLSFAVHQIISSDKALYCPMIDARRMEVYTALYDANNNYILPTQAMIIDENSFSEYFNKGQKIYFCGNGAPKCKDFIKDELAIFMEIICDASFLITLGTKAFEEKKFEDIAYYEPNYFKAPNITKAKTII